MLNEMIKRYTINHDKKISSICQPLFNLFQISLFTYYRVNSNGNFFLLSNGTSITDFYYSEKMYLNNPYLVEPKLIRSGYVFTNSTNDKKYLEDLEVSKNKFQLNNTFLIVNHEVEFYEGFLFGAFNRKTPIHHYLDNIELLKKFGKYFKQETRSLITKMDDENYNLLKAKGNAFSLRDPSIPLSANNAIYKKFLKIISPLSCREQQCLELFQQGHSAQSTAAKLGLSRRTVEHYFISIKNKLNCHSKWDLLNR